MWRAPRKGNLGQKNKIRFSQISVFLESIENIMHAGIAYLKKQRKMLAFPFRRELVFRSESLEATPLLPAQFWNSCISEHTGVRREDVVDAKM